MTWHFIGVWVLDFLLSSISNTQLEELTIHARIWPNITLDLSILGKLKKQLRFLELKISSTIEDFAPPKVKDREIEAFAHVLRRSNSSEGRTFLLMLDNAVFEVCGYGLRYQIPKKKPCDKGKWLDFQFDGMESDKIMLYIRSDINREELSGTIDKLSYRLENWNENIVYVVNNLHKLLNITELRTYFGTFDHCPIDMDFDKIFADISEIKTLKKFKFYVWDAPPTFVAALENGLASFPPLNEFSLLIQSPQFYQEIDFSSCLDLSSLVKLNFYIVVPLSNTFLYKIIDNPDSLKNLKTLRCSDESLFNLEEERFHELCTRLAKIETLSTLYLRHSSTDFDSENLKVLRGNLKENTA